MGEGQQRYNTEISKEYYYKYRPRTEWNLQMVQGSDKNVQLKTWVGLKYGLFTGFSAAAIMFSYEDGPRVIVRNAIERSFKHGTPWVVSGIIYGLTTSTVANIRKEEGPLNHFIAGLASGAFFGSWYKSTRVGGWCSFLFSTTGYIVKAAVDSDELPDFNFRKPAALNLYRTGWFTDRPDPEGVQDGDKDDSFKRYRPELKY